MRKKLIILMLILCISSAYALDAEFEIVNNKIYLDEHADFSLRLNNPYEYLEQFTVHSPDISWYVDLEPSDLSVEGKSRKVFLLSIVPSVWAQTGPSLVNVVIKTNTQKIELQVPIYIKSFDESKKEYAPSVEFKVNFPELVDPRKEIPVEVNFRNRNKLDMKELNLHISGEFFDEYKTFSLGPQEERNEKYIFIIPKRTIPKESELKFTLSYMNRSLNTERIHFLIIPYSNYIIKEDTIKEFFKEITDYVITNDGNVKKIGTFDVKANVLETLFIKSLPDYDKKIFREQKLIWDLELLPDQEVKITLVKNYRPIVYILLLLIFAGMMYFIYRSPIIVKKESIILGSPEQGISELKVLVHIRNRTSELIENVTLTDLLPPLASLESEVHLGSMTPTQILKNEKKGTLIKWHMEALEPFEERIVSYKARTKMVILGGLTLPPSKVKFKAKTGSERIVKSNKAIMTIGI